MFKNDDMTTLSFNMDRPTTFGAYATVAMFTWVIFLLYDLRSRPHPPPLLKRLGMFCHTIPAAAFFGTSILAQNSNDYYLVWLGFLVAFRYWRTLAQIYFWNQYKPALSTGNDKFKTSDCTVICPTVGPEGNLVFDELVASILVNKPAALIFACNTIKATVDVHKFLKDFRSLFEAGDSRYQRIHNLAGFPMDKYTELRIEDVGISSKRQQTAAGLKQVKTAITVSVDDTAIWAPTWLTHSLPAFNDPKVGLVATRKWVKHLPRYTNPNASTLKNAYNNYVSGFWNAMGGLYLIRHNFEMQSTNSADGGIFCVSARSNLILTSIVQTPRFYHAFTHEHVLGLGTHFAGFGPLNADDDNFVTRYAINKGWDVKAQCTPPTTMTTVLGSWPQNAKFASQCTRWSRSTFRQNPIALFADRTVWAKWPWTTWTTYLAWLYNAALLWDGLAVYVLVSSQMYARSSHPHVLLAALLAPFQAAKLVKTREWWVAHPMDFLLYYLLPAYQLFTYYHSLKKVYTAITFWNTEWSGRPNLPAPEKGELRDVAGLVVQALEAEGVKVE